MSENMPYTEAMEFFHNDEYPDAVELYTKFIQTDDDNEEDRLIEEMKQMYRNRGQK